MSNKAKDKVIKSAAIGARVPKLRFPAFRDAGEWDKKLIEDFFLVGSSKRVLQEEWTTQGVPFYRTRELVSLSKREPFSSKVFISEELFREISEKYGLPVEGDFLVSGVGTLGISYQVQSQDRFYFKDGNVLWFSQKGGIVSKFFKYCFEADEIQDQILGQMSISTVGTYTIQNAKATRFSCPPDLEEQQKIADCLSSVDELITLEAQKLDTLRAHKKGLMRQLFPAEGETLPKRRFPEFRDAGEWEKIPIGKISEIITGNTPSTTMVEYYGGNRLFVSPADMTGHRFICNTKTTLTELGYSKTRQIPAGSVLFVCIGSTIGKVAQNKIDCATNQQINAVVPFESYSSGFIYYSLDLNASNIAELAGKQAVPIINKTVFSAIVLDLPSLNEQRLIAECLSSLDELIGAQSEKLEALKTHKKGLMQQLFPSADGNVT